MALHMAICAVINCQITKYLSPKLTGCTVETFSNTVTTLHPLHIFCNSFPRPFLSLSLKKGHNKTTLQTEQRTLIISHLSMSSMFPTHIANGRIFVYFLSRAEAVKPYGISRNRGRNSQKSVLQPHNYVFGFKIFE